MVEEKHYTATKRNKRKRKPSVMYRKGYTANVYRVLFVIEAHTYALAEGTCAWRTFYIIRNRLHK